MAKRNQLTIENRIKNRKGVQKFRLRHKEKKIKPSITECSSFDISKILQNTTQETSYSENHQKQPVLASNPPTTENCQNQLLPTPSIENCNSQLVQRNNQPLVSKYINFQHTYKTQSALSKAVAKTKKSLPSSPSKRKAVVAKLLRAFDDGEQRDVIGDKKSEKKKTNIGLSSTLVKDIKLFYERDDISRISPNVKDVRKFVNSDTGDKEERQIRHLAYKLSEVYLKFLDEFKGMFD